MAKVSGNDRTHDKPNPIIEVGIPLFTADLPTTNGLGSSVALRLVSEIGGEGNVVVFNGFYGVYACAVRYDELRHVLKYYPKVRIVQPELCDVIPNTAQNAFEQVTAILRQYPLMGSLKAIWSAWDVPQLGAVQALIAAGRTEILTYSVDCRDTLERLARCITEVPTGSNHRSPKKVH